MQKPKFVVINMVAKNGGWGPIQHMVGLMCHYFDADYIEIDSKIGLFKQLKYTASARVRNSDKPDAIIIVQAVSGIPDIATLSNLNTRFNRVVAWVFDSFFTEFLPNIRLSRLVDHLFITSENDLAFYKSNTDVSVSLLRRGSDVRGLGGSNLEKDIDVLRIGRQPRCWESDEKNAATFAALNISYHGRPPDTIIARSPHAGLMLNYLQRAKFVLAHTNLLDDSVYTHPTKEYFTERWLDVFSCGGIVAGAPPKSDKLYNHTLWKGSLLELKNESYKEDTETIAEAVRNWQSKTADHNYNQALMLLDWRHRFKEMTDYFDVNIKKLNDSLHVIESLLITNRNS